MSAQIEKLTPTRENHIAALTLKQIFFCGVES